MTSWLPPGYSVSCALGLASLAHGVALDVRDPSGALVTSCFAAPYAAGAIETAWLMVAARAWLAVARAEAGLLPLDCIR